MLVKSTTKKSYENDFSQGPIFSQIVKFFIPIMLSNMLQIMYNAADQAVVGRFVGSDALGAVGSTSALINLIVCVVMGITIGTSTVVARHFGASNNEAVSRAVHTSIVLAVISGTFIGVVGFVFSRPMLVLMGTQPDVLNDAVLYMKITFAGLPIVAIYNFGSAILRAVGDTRRPMNYLIIAGLINVALNFVFVAGFGMSVDGVALATVISQTFSGFLTIRCLINSDASYKLCIKKLRIHKSECVQIIRIGIPASLQSFMFSVSNTIIQTGVNSISKAAVSGCAAATTVENFVYQAQNSLYHASLTFAGQNYGAKKYDRIRKSIIYCLVIVTVVALALGILVTVFNDELIGIFIDDNPEAVGYAKIKMQMIALPYFICGWMEVFCGGMRGMNRAVPPLVSTVFGVCVLRIGWIYTVFRKYHTAEMLFLSYPFSWLLTAVISGILFIYYLRKNQKEDLKSL